MNPSLLKYKNSNGYIALATLTGTNWQDYFFNNIEKANNFIQSNNQTNSYNNVALYKSNYRNSNNILELTEYFIDIDNHLDPLSEEQARVFVKNTLEPLYDIAIPTPSLINYTGRGLQIHFNLTGARDIIKWQHTEEALIERISNICYKQNALLNAYGLEIDKKVSDKVRYLRTAYTMNTKANKECKPIFQSQAVYTQEEIIDNYNLTYTTGKGKKKQSHQLKELNNLSKEQVLKATNSQLKTFKQFNKAYTTETLNQERKQDLFKLIGLRNIKGVREGYRSNLLSVAVQLERETTNDISELFNNLLGYNNYFIEPLRESEVKAWCHSACHKAYIFTNKYIIDKLGITEQEQEQLSVIISRKVKNKRYYSKNSEILKAKEIERYKPIKMANRTNKAYLKAKARELRQQGYKVKQIANQLGISIRTIWRYLGGK